MAAPVAQNPFPREPLGCAILTYRSYVIVNTSLLHHRWKRYNSPLILMQQGDRQVRKLRMPIVYMRRISPKCKWACMAIADNNIHLLIDKAYVVTDRETIINPNRHSSCSKKTRSSGTPYIARTISWAKPDSYDRTNFGAYIMWSATTFLTIRFTLISAIALAWL